METDTPPSVPPFSLPDPNHLTDEEQKKVEQLKILPCPTLPKTRYSHTKPVPPTSRSKTVREDYETQLKEWLANKEAWEMNQRNAYLKEKFLWRLAKDQLDVDKKDSKKKKKQEAQFKNPTGFTPFMRSQGLDAQ